MSDASWDDEIREALRRLARPHRSGGTVVERASLQAAGIDFDAAIGWIEAHGGEAEEAAKGRPSGGLHGAREDAQRADRQPARYVLPPRALG